MTRENDTNNLIGGISAYCQPEGRYVRVIATDGDKYVRYLGEGEYRVEKACCFYKRPFHHQGGREQRYAAKLLSGKKRGCPIDKNFWSKL